MRCHRREGCAGRPRPKGSAPTPPCRGWSSASVAAAWGTLSPLAWGNPSRGFRSSLTALTGGDLVRDLLAAEPSLYRPADSRRDPSDEGADPQAERCDIDFALVALDGLDYRFGNVFGRARAHARWQLGAALREHPRIADE